MYACFCEQVGNRGTVCRTAIDSRIEVNESCGDEWNYTMLKRQTRSDKASKEFTDSSRAPNTHTIMMRLDSFIWMPQTRCVAVAQSDSSIMMPVISMASHRINYILSVQFCLDPRGFTHHADRAVQHCPWLANVSPDADHQQRRRSPNHRYSG